MKLIVGLGNPGNRYQNNRHNVGHMVIDALVTPKGSTLLKSDKFMNDSGDFVLSQYTKYQIPYTNLYVIHDDLDIKLGEYKIQLGKGPKEHNGLNDIYEKLNTNKFWHIRIGVDNRDTNNRVRGEEYVLKDFNDEEKVLLKKVIDEICKKLVTL